MGSDALPSWTETHSSNMSTAALRFQILAPAHKKQRKKVKPFKVDQKGEKLTIPPWQWRQNFDQAKPTQNNIKFKKSARSSMLLYSLGLTGRDPQGEIAMEALCKSSS